MWSCPNIVYDKLKHYDDCIKLKANYDPIDVRMHATMGYVRYNYIGIYSKNKYARATYRKIQCFCKIVRYHPHI